MASRFVVSVVDRVDPAVVARDYGLQTDRVYTRVFKGFSVSMSDEDRSDLLQDARVRSVGNDRRVSVAGGSTQLGAPWGLDRIDQRSSTLDGAYVYGATGQGVTAYIVDTGIRYSHKDFEGRASFGFDAFGGNGSDCYGHGTHVAGTVGGNLFGVAKDVSLVSVRVIDCDGMGSTSTLVAGLEWVAANARMPAVVNLSLIADADDLIDDAVRRLIAQGIAVVVAAGNADSDACGYSPARVTDALTIGASAPYDDRTAASNTGSCVDWYAPGLGITSDAATGDDQSTSMSGTSTAAPHTSGAAALFLEQNPGASPDHVFMGLTSWLTTGVVDLRLKGNARGDLLYTRGTASSENLAPIADFSFSCADLECAFTDKSTDIDGEVVAWAWDFGNGSGSGARNSAVTFDTPGSYTVALTVTDDKGSAARNAQVLSVEQAPEGIQLSAYGYKVRGSHHVDLVWSGAAGDQVDVYRDGQRTAVVSNSGNYTDVPGAKGNATYTYRLCEAGTTVCSVDVTVSP